MKETSVSFHGANWTDIERAAADVAPNHANCIIMLINLFVIAF